MSTVFYSYKLITCLLLELTLHLSSFIAQHIFFSGRICEFDTLLNDMTSLHLGINVSVVTQAQVLVVDDHYINFDR